MNRCSLCLVPFESPQTFTLESMPSRAQHLDPIGSTGVDDTESLRLVLCDQCGLLQLDCTPVPYFREVVRSAGISEEMAAFRSSQFHTFVSNFGLADLPVVEIGCGRGEYLSILQLHAPKARGVEYGKSSIQYCMSQGLQVSRYFPGETSGGIPGGPFSGFILLNFLEHVPNLRSFLGGIRANLTESAVGIIEVPNSDMILRENLVTELMTDHLYYFTDKTLRLLLELNGFEVLSCDPAWHEYSLSATVRVREQFSLDSFAAVIPTVRAQIDDFLAGRQPEAVVVWGAGHQAFAALSLNHLASRVAYIVDSAPFKHGRQSPATRINIHPPQTLFDDPAVNCVIIMAGSFSDEVLSQIRERTDRDLQLAILRPHGLELA